MTSTTSPATTAELQTFGTQDRKSAITKPVGALLRGEGAVVLVLTAWAYQTLGGNWWLFAALFLVPDLFMLGYLRNKQFGAAVYNAGHTYLAPAALALVGAVLGTSVLLLIALIWAAHIGFDRLLGYGLKGPSDFKDTHLG
jgi:hypothetical protein